MTYVFIRFIEKWIEEGRFPREELRIRWSIAVLGAVVFLALLRATSAVPYAPYSGIRNS